MCVEVNMIKNRTCLYAGSFDPFTNGHLSIVEESSKLFDKVYICVANNPDKRRFVDKVKMAEAMDKTFKEAGLENCVVIIHEGLVADCCEELNVGYLIRGLRNTSDYLYEENIAKINNELNPGLRTLYFRAKDDSISSSMVREFHKYGKNIEQYVPKYILELFE